MQMKADGSWAPAQSTWEGHEYASYAVGPTDVAWMGWTETPPGGARDVFPSFGK